MAKFEAELSVKVDGFISDLDKAEKKSDDFSSRVEKNNDNAKKSFDPIIDGTEKLNKAISNQVRQNNALESVLLSLSSRFNQGIISQDNFDKSSKAIGGSLALGRQRVAEFQRQLDILKLSADKSSKSIVNTDVAVSKLTNKNKDLSKSTGLANSTAMEFNRIIQDAPFGMIGIGNNIQQLTSNFGQLQAKTGSFGAAFKATIASMLTSGNLLSLGISVVTSAWTAYVMYSQRANKANKETKDSTELLIEALSEKSRVLYEASKSSGAEAAQLRILYGITQDVSKSVSERKNSADRLIKQYPELLKNFTSEQIILGQAKTAYDNLSQSILATARAQAAYSKIGEKSAQQLAIDETNKALREQVVLLEKQAKEQKEINKATQGANAYGASNVISAQSTYKISNQIADANKKINENLLERAKIQESILDLEKIAVTNQIAIADGFGLGVPKIEKAKKELFDFGAKLEEIRIKSDSSLDSTGLLGLDVETEKIRQKYEGLYRNLDKINADIVKSTQYSESQKNKLLSDSIDIRNKLYQNEANENLRNSERYEQEQADLIQSILDKAGVSRISNREKDLQANKAYYDSLIRQHRENSDVIVAIQEALGQTINNINSKWDSKALSDVEKINDKISGVINKNVPLYIKGSSRRLETEFADRVNIVKAYFQAIRNIYEQNNLDASDLINQEDNVINDLMAKKGEEAGRAFSDKFSATISAGALNAYVGLFEGLGEAIASGGNILNAAGKTLLGAFGSIMVQLGELVITTSGAMAAIQKLFLNPLNPLGPVAGLAAGAALIALGSAFSTSAKNIGKGSGAAASSAVSSSSTSNMPMGRLYNNDRQVVELKLKNTELAGAVNLNNNRNNRLS